MNKEEITVLQYVNWFKMQYPQHINSLKVNYDRYKASIGVASKQKRLRTNVKGYPDITLSLPTKLYAGLFIEAKADGSKLLNKKSEFATPHLKEQAAYLKYFSDIGYRAVFAIGLDEMILITNNYIKGD